MHALESPWTATPSPGEATILWTVRVLLAAAIARAARAGLDRRELRRLLDELMTNEEESDG